HLLKALIKSGDGDGALAAFDAMLEHMPAATELFSILKSNQQVRSLFCDILGGAPRLANVITQRPHVLDVAIDSSSFLSTLRNGNLHARFQKLHSHAHKEEFLDSLRDLVREESFLIGVQTFSKILDPLETGHAYTLLADHSIEACLTYIETEFEKEHGKFPKGSCLFLGMGRLGAREMSATS